MYLTKPFYIIRVLSYEFITERLTVVKSEILIFFVYSLLACDQYIDQARYTKLVSNPQSARRRKVASSPLPSAQACPKM